VSPAQPLQNRILIATSQDGLNWQRRNQVFCDSGDVPDAVIGPGDSVYLFFQGLWTHFIDGIMVGVSPDGISNWEFRQIHIPGTEPWPGRPCDPDVIFRSDTFRLYFTGDPVNDLRPETYSAVSTDGAQFTIESGVRFEVTGSPVLDPSLLWTGDTLQYFAGGAPPGENWHAHSTDGLAFSRQPNFSGESLLMANGLGVAGGFRFYGFTNSPQGGIRSLFSIVGRDWTVEPGYRLWIDSSNGMESRYVKDPAVVRRGSIFIMYYVTRKPLTGNEEGTAPDRPCPALQVRPNPCRGALEVRITHDARATWGHDPDSRRIRSCPQGSCPGPEAVGLYDASGCLVAQLKAGANDVSRLSSGVYFIRPGPSAVSRVPLAVRKVGGSP